MKQLFIMSLCLGLHYEGFAEIKNGYVEELELARITINNLDSLSKQDLSADQYARLEKYQNFCHKTIEKLQTNFERTQKLILLLRLIDPQLFNEINEIRDREGNFTDVYIKVVDGLENKFHGVTFMNRHNENHNVCISKYGEFTIGVYLTHRSVIQALFILVHELGHIRYVIPNFADYSKFYKIYQKKEFQGIIPGHLSSDPSHESVINTIRSFKKSYRSYKYPKLNNCMACQ